ncbi:MAG TPA: hypothetical protein VIJ70_00355 [Gaiellaceae bacterium]
MDERGRRDDRVHRSSAPLAAPRFDEQVGQARGDELVVRKRDEALSPLQRCPTKTSKLGVRASARRLRVR